MLCSYYESRYVPRNRAPLEPFTGAPPSSPWRNSCRFPNATTSHLATRMSTFGNLQEFRHGEEGGIVAYIERVELYYRANDVAADKQVPVFLSVVGGRVYSLLRDLSRKFWSGENFGPKGPKFQENWSARTTFP